MSVSSVGVQPSSVLALPTPSPSSSSSSSSSTAASPSSALGSRTVSVINPPPAQSARAKQRQRRRERKADAQNVVGAGIQDLPIIPSRGGGGAPPIDDDQFDPYSWSIGSWFTSAPLPAGGGGAPLPPAGGGGAPLPPAGGGRAPAKGYLAWMWNWSPPSTKAPPSSLHLHDLTIPKKEKLPNMGTKEGCLEALKEVCKHRTALLSSLDAVWESKKSANALLPNKSEIQKAMKQTKELDDLSHYCLQEYLWAEHFDPLKAEATGKLHTQLNVKHGELNELQSKLIDNLRELIERPKKPAPEKKESSLIEKIADFAATNGFITLPAFYSLCLCFTKEPWPTYRALPLIAGLAAGGTMLVARGEEKPLKDAKELAKSLASNSLNIALPLATAAAVTAYALSYLHSHNDCMIDDTATWWTPHLIGIAALANIVSLWRSAPAKNRDSGWLNFVQQSPKNISKSLCEYAKTAGRMYIHLGPYTGAATGAIIGGVGFYGHDWSAVSSLEVFTASVLIHSLASGIVYLAE